MTDYYCPYCGQDVYYQDEMCEECARHMLIDMEREFRPMNRKTPHGHCLECGIPIINACICKKCFDESSIPF